MTSLLLFLLEPTYARNVHCFVKLPFLFPTIIYSVSTTKCLAVSSPLPTVINALSPKTASLLAILRIGNPDHICEPKISLFLRNTCILLPLLTASPSCSLGLKVHLFKVQPCVLTTDTPSCVKYSHVY